MVDVMGLLSIGSLNGDLNSNGLFLFKDGSFAFGYQLKGFPWYSLTNEEAIILYEKFRNLINNLDYFSAGEGAIYQFISQRDYDFSKEEKRILSNNFIIRDKNYFIKEKDGTLKPYEPTILHDILDYNNKEFIKIIKNEDFHKFKNFIFVRYKPIYARLGVKWFDVLKNIFLGIDTVNNRDLVEANGILENIIETHNSKFEELGARPLTLIEMINAVRNYFGFTSIKNIPNLKNDDHYLRILFPGKITYQHDFLKVEELVKVKDGVAEKLSMEEEHILNELEEVKEVDINNIRNENTLQASKMKDDLFLIFVDILGYSAEKVKLLSLKELYFLLKENIEEVIKKLPDSYYKNLQYFDKKRFELYILEKEFKNWDLEKRTKYLKVYSVNEIPERLSINFGEGFHTMYGDYVITINFKKIDKKTSQIKMRRQIVLESVKISMPIMKWFISIEAAEAKIQMLKQLQIELEGSDFSRTETSIYLTLKHDTPYDPREKAIGGYETKLDMRLIKEKDAPDFHIFKGAMPTGISNGAMVASKRTFLLNTTNVAQLAPFLTEEYGADTLVVPVGLQRGLLGIDLNKAPAGHFSVQGATGGGKSFLTNKIALQYKALGDTVIATEKGNSFERAAIFFGGKIYRPDLSGTIKINPFVMPKAAFDEENPDHEEIKTNSYLQMVAAMAQMCNNYDSAMKQVYYKILKRAFETPSGKINTRYVKNYSITPTVLYKIMSVDNDLREHKELLHSFEQFTERGAYAKIFDGNEGLDLNYPYIQIDYSKLGEAEMKDFIFKSLLKNIFFEMSLSKNRKFLNINDEFWDVISSGLKTSSGNAVDTAMDQIEAFFRVARKLGGKIGVISQSIGDIANSPISKAIISNIYHTFFTQTSPADLKTIQDLFLLDDSHIQQINELSRVPGKYSEYFLALAPYGDKIPGIHRMRTLNTKFKYYPTDFEIALFTTDDDDRLIYDFIYEELGANLKDIEREHMLKAVLFFMLFFPKGTKINKKFREILYRYKNDYRVAFNEYIKSETGQSPKEILAKISWSNFLYG